ncbi:hypothetical protein RHAB21_00979 [Pseudorhizobium halotolerans]|uniref:Uncharacterized protein n=1 Tax=Pseudorhizobium halotolerans TaxID=1233081 RepID=A0ABM8PZP4_9HYPH|nr:hypothetical protein RHAB21_00979 [Pseudorhizobium halotolerans]
MTQKQMPSNAVERHPFIRMNKLLTALQSLCQGGAKGAL